MGLGMMAVNLTAPAATSSVTISSLPTGAPVSVRVSVTVRVVSGAETLYCPGPFSAGPPGVSPVAPNLLAVSLAGGQFMSTRGGEDVNLYGSDIGMFPADVSVSYTNGPITLDASNCRIVAVGAHIVCSTAEGVGAGFAWRVKVGSASSNASAALLSYDLPVINGFQGAGVEGGVGAITAGGQQVNITGSMFGPAGAQYITSVNYAPVGYPTTFSAVGCTVSVPHSQITCLTNAGAGMRLNWLVRIAEQSSTTPKTDYEAPQITNVTRGDNGDTAQLPTAGGTIVLISGTNLGAVGAKFITGTLGSVGLYLGGLMMYQFSSCKYKYKYKYKIYL